MNNNKLKETLFSNITKHKDLNMSKAVSSAVQWTVCMAFFGFDPMHGRWEKYSLPSLLSFKKKRKKRGGGIGDFNMIHVN